MSIPVPNLDDRTFQDIVDEAKQLIPRYCPEWTNHNLSDPGIALIEIFAWMTEMTLFKINQIPDRFYAKFLELVGVEPYPATPAVAQLTFWLTSGDQAVRTIRAGTQVATNDLVAGEPVMFMTDTDLVIRQPNLAHCLVGTARGALENLTEELQNERAWVTCFPSLYPNDAVYFGFTESLAANVVDFLFAARAEGIGIEPARPPLRWEAWAGEGWAPADVLADETGGLNRNGSVLLGLPLRHPATTLAGVAAHWVRGVLVEPLAGQPNYTRSPQVADLVPTTRGGRVRARHAEPVGTEILGRSDGTPGQTFRVSRTPVLPARRGEHVRVVGAEETRDWEEVEDFSESGAEDLHYTWDRTSGEISFGPRVRYAGGGQQPPAVPVLGSDVIVSSNGAGQANGSTVRQHGAVPPSSVEIVITGYRHGGGDVGNVGARTITVLTESLPYIQSVENPEPARGGRDAESLSNLRRRGPLALRTGQRAVTAGDFARLAREASPAVARARCVPPSDPDGPVRVLLVPHVLANDSRRLDLDDLALSEDLLDRVSTHLEARRLVGVNVEVGTPHYQGASVAVRVMAEPQRDHVMVEHRVVEALYDFINPLTGGPDGTGWPFDTDLSVGSAAQAVGQVDGVGRVLEVTLFEADMRQRIRYGPATSTIHLDPDALLMSFQHQVVVVEADHHPVVAE